MKGEGVKPNVVEAVKLNQLAAEQGDADAQNDLGGSYYNGEGMKQNFAEAVKWRRLAAAQGHVNAQCNLGLLLFGTEKE